MIEDNMAYAILCLLKCKYPESSAFATYICDILQKELTYRNLDIDDILPSSVISIVTLYENKYLTKGGLIKVTRTLLDGIKNKRNITGLFSVALDNAITTQEISDLLIPYAVGKSIEENPRIVRDIKINSRAVNSLLTKVKEYTGINAFEDDIIVEIKRQLSIR